MKAVFLSRVSATTARTSAPDSVSGLRPTRSMEFSVRLGLVPGVVGVAFQDGVGAIDLLEQYYAGELVRECHSPEGEQ